MNEDVTDAVKDQVLKACRHWLLLDLDDIKNNLGVGLTLLKWKTKTKKPDYVYLLFRALPGLNFESWAHRHWKWDGKFEIKVTWGEHYSRGKDYQMEYEIDKQPGQRPLVLDCRNGQLWMQAR